MLATKNFRLAYENWCWATHAPKWSHVWDIVQRVDRPNVGLCLDTFQTCGGEWADPTTPSGIIEANGADALQMTFKQSLEALAATVAAEKIFLLQVSDAYRMDPPLSIEMDENELRPRGRWSHDYRPLPYDGGYLPVTDFTRAVLRTGFRGWMSIEVFDGKEAEKPSDVELFTKKAMAGLEKLLQEAGVGLHSQPY
jgi:sugar phosphate isomerase/epimerase